MRQYELLFATELLTETERAPAVKNKLNRWISINLKIFPQICNFNLEKKKKLGSVRLVIITQNTRIDGPHIQPFAYSFKTASISPIEKKQSTLLSL